MKKPVVSQDTDVAKLQRDNDMPKTMAEKMVKEGRRRRLVEMPLPDKVQ